MSVHSDAASFEQINKKYPTYYGDLPSRDGVLRCSDVNLWEVEVIAAELGPVLGGSHFFMGGDLNSARLFDSKSNQENRRLFENLDALGYRDTRLRHHADEVQTFFKSGCRPFQLDHVFADRETESRVSSWRVLTEPVTGLNLSDHAPIEVLFDG